jgi:hypothetical protein
MKEIQYLDLILNGILKNERFLKNFIIRKQKEAENKYFISEAEFFQKCNDTIALLENRFESQFLEKRRKMLDSIESLNKSNKPFNKEMDLANSFTLERFNINLSDITNGKYKVDLWYSQIMHFKNCLFEIIIKKYTATSKIKDLDINKYLKFVFSKKSISRESKKYTVFQLMAESNQEKTISNYRIWIDYVFNKQNYWKELNQEDKNSFKELRKKSFNEMNDLYKNFIISSPKTTVEIVHEFEEAIINRLIEEPFQKTTLELINGQLPKDIFKLAIVIGKIDFIKRINQQKAVKNHINKIKSKELTINEIALKCVLEGTNLDRKKAKEELEDTIHKSSDKLYNKYIYWMLKAERIGDPGSHAKLRNKIKLYERVIQFLPDHKKSDAESELKTLESYLSKY